MTEQQMIDKVMAIMNEYGSETGFELLSEDTVKLDVYIEEVLPDAVLQVSALLPPSQLTVATYAGTSTENINDGCTVLVLPDDYFRFISLRLSNWAREVQQISERNSEQYKIQHNPITRSGVNKPCCVYQSKNTIECFPKGALSYFKYAKPADITTASDSVNAAIAYMCASLVYSIFENHSASDRMKALSIELIPKE